MGKSRTTWIKVFIFTILAGIILYWGFQQIQARLPRKLVSIILPTRIKVMTYAINYGNGNDGIHSLPRIAKVIRSESPHLVCLNNVDYKTNRAMNEEQARRLAADLGMNFTFARNSSLDGGWTGNAILSEFPIEFAENKIYKEGYSRETKSLLHIIIRKGERRLHFFGTELSADSLRSANQIKELLDFVFDWGSEDPIIICGNFNLKPTHRRIHEMAYYFNDVGLYLRDKPVTWPAQNPQTRYDYIFINKLLLPVAISIPDNELTRLASTHLPVVAQLKFVE